MHHRRRRSLVGLTAVVGRSLQVCRQGEAPSIGKLADLYALQIVTNGGQSVNLRLHQML